MKLEWPANKAKYKGFAVAANRSGVEMIVVAQTKEDIELLWPAIMGHEATDIDMAKVLPASVKVRME